MYKFTTASGFCLAALLVSSVAAQAQVINFSLPLVTGAANKLNLGTFTTGTTLQIVMSGNGDLVDSRYQTFPDGSLVVPVGFPQYSYANPGASGYPTANGGDGINHYPGGGINYNHAVPSHYGFAGKETTDTTDPLTIRHGAVVGTFSPTPDRSDWFLIGLGVSLVVPAGNPNLFIAVNDIRSPDNHGSYTGQLTIAAAQTPEPATLALLLLGAAVPLRHRRTR